MFHSQIKIEQLKVEIGKADTYEHALSRAERAIKRHDGAGATKVLSDALTISPGAAEAKLLLAVATIVNGNWSGILDKKSDISKNGKVSQSEWNGTCLPETFRK